ncbi:hypothetical protein H0H92_000131 [Tricholoma furcatifolium]|nr:hypothetical protein H0H92_000131 [Tricholoma furcatifolium]
MSTVEEYKQIRAGLIGEDRALRRDQLYHPGDRELRASQIVKEIRAAETSTIWTQEHASIPHPFPGMEFLTGMSHELLIIIAIILTTSASRERDHHEDEVVCTSEQSALLHCHLDATVNAATLLRLALKHPSIHVRVSEPLTAENIKNLLPTFRGLSAKECSEASQVGITDASYVAESWVSLRNAREKFSTELGGPEGFDRWVIGSMMINPTEAYVTHNTIKKVLTLSYHMAEVHQHLHSIEDYVREFLYSSIADGISYVEARINFLYKYMVGADGEENIPHREWLLMFDQVLNEVKASLKKEGRGEEFIGVRIIYSTIRFITNEELEWYLEDCIALKKEFPHLIAGFDLVGNENELTPLIDYAEPLLRFKQRQKEEGVDIPFIFHAGETLGDGTQADDNLYDAILLDTKRIGHGYSLAKHPKLVEICRQKGIAVEMCPISNEILRLTSSMPMHILPVLVNSGVPVALCSDDPAVFGNMGLTFDFYQVLVSSELTGLGTLRRFAMDSLEHSTLADEEKRHAIAVWEKQWTKFIDRIIEENIV